MTDSQLNKELVNTMMANHHKYNWDSHSLQVIRGCYATWTDRNGVSHRVDGFDKTDLLGRVKAL